MDDAKRIAMDTVIAFLSLAFFVAFFIGLIKPSLVRMPNRKRASAVYLGGGFVLSIIGSILYPTEKASQLLKLKHQPLQNTKSKKIRIWWKNTQGISERAKENSTRYCE